MKLHVPLRCIKQQLILLRCYQIYVCICRAEAAKNVSSHPTLVYLKNSIDITPYIESAANKIGSLRMPEQLTSAIYSASARMNAAMADKNCSCDALRTVAKAYNEVYQQVSFKTC